jgi:hypothetical protein
MAKQQAQKAEPRERVRRLQVGVTPAERATLAARAQAVGMSVAGYLRAAGLCQPLVSALDHQTGRTLATLHGELGRIVALLPPEAAALRVEIAGLRARLAADLEALG